MIPRWARRLTAGGAARLAEALDEAACVASADGTILGANALWTSRCGGDARAPSGAAAYRAFRDAARVGRGRARLEAGDLTVAALADGAFLLRLAAQGAGAGPAPRAALEPFLLASPFGVALFDSHDATTGRIVECNAVLRAIAGPAAGLGASLADLVGAAAAAAAASHRDDGREGPLEVGVAAFPDRVADLWLTQAPEGAVIYLHEVTEQRRMQTRLAQRNRMESIGQLAGGVAHDFNNLLSAIRLRTDELLLRHALGDPSYDSLAEIRATVDRAASVVRQLLTFSRRATLQREALDLGEALTDTAVLLRRLVREDVELAIDYGPNLPLVRIDRSQLETAVVNLVVNARDALRAKGGGAVRIVAARLDLAGAQALGYGGPDAGELALLEVSDDGPGMPAEVLDKIFEPFFTTKAAGEGTGLGLATVYGVVKQADGWITAVSEQGAGACFRIFLPVYTAPLAFEPAAPAPSAPRPPRDLSGAGRILFVEDEALVRGVAARLLRARGYEVMEAADGEEALALAEANAGALDLIISDVIMPGMDGPSLLREVRRFLPSTPVMFISGYAEAEFSDLLEGAAGVSFLPKPLDIKTMAERVKEILRPAEQAA